MNIVEDLERARRAYEGREWAVAYDRLSAAAMVGGQPQPAVGHPERSRRPGQHVARHSWPGLRAGGVVALRADARLPVHVGTAAPRDDRAAVRCHRDVGILVGGGAVLGWAGAALATARHLRAIEPK